MRRIANSPFALTLLGLVACGEAQQDQRTEEVIAPIETAAPAVTRDLVSQDGTLLSVRNAIAAEDGLLLFDGASDEVFLLSTKLPFELKRISRPRQFGQSDVFAMAAHSNGLSLLGVDGSLRLMEKSDPDRIERSIHAFAPIHRPMALGEWTDVGWVAVHALLVMGDAPVDSVIVSSLDSAGKVGRVFAFERSGPSRPGAFVVDPVGARASARQVVLTGADPARIITITPEGVRIDTLLETPRRALNDEELAGMQRLFTGAARPAMLRDARLPDRRPAAVSALPFDGGYLVVAQGGEVAEFVDLYCGRTFRRTVLARATLRSVFLVAGGVVTVDDPPRDRADEPDRIAYYRIQDFTNECSK